MALKGVSRRLGAGVSSYPVLRFYALIEGPTESLDDDVLLELKEINDPGSLPGLRLYPGLSHRFNAERVVEHQRLLQETTQNDPYLGWAAVGPISFRVRHRTKYQKGVSVGRIVEKLEEGDLVTEDLATLAHTAGRLLARSHALAPTLTGEPGLGVIAQTLNKNPDALAPEIEDFVETYGPLTQADHSRLLSLIDNEGELLGYRGH